MPINALDFLEPALREAVTNHTNTQNLRVQLIQAAAAAAKTGSALYVPTGLWLVEANNGTQTGWAIDLPDHKSLLIQGDGDATVIRRMATPTLALGSALIWIRGNTGINLTFENLLVDGNEANCPIDSKVIEIKTDGTANRFAYNVGYSLLTKEQIEVLIANIDSGLSTTLITELRQALNGELTPDILKKLTDKVNAELDGALSATLVTGTIETILSRGEYVKEGTYPNRRVVFAETPSAGATVRLYRIYAHEQSANMKFVPGTGKPNNIALNNITMTGCIGDGFQTNVQIHSLQISNWRSYGRTRRPRADIQLSRIPLEATNITNFIGDAFEMEPSETSQTHVINLSNMVVRGAFDVAGDVNKHADGTGPHFANINAVNIRHLAQYGVGLPISNFFRIKGNFTNCSFVHTYRIQRCQVTFTGGNFKVLGTNADKTKANHVQVWNDQAGNFAEFNGVSFEHDEGITKGHFIEAPVATSDTGRETRLINCSHVQVLDYFTVANRCGTMFIDGGRLGGKISVVHIANGAGGAPPYLTNIILNNPLRWFSPLVNIDGSSGPITITMAGTFDAEKLQPVANPAPTKNTNITWLGGFTGTVKGDPNNRIRGLPGLTLSKATPTPGEAYEWRYQNQSTDTFAATTYTQVKP